MSGEHGAPSGFVAEPQGTPFAFTAENAARAKAIIAKYPPGKQASAVMPLLDLAQRQNKGWLPKEAMDHVAEMLGMARMRVYEVASFYEMYNRRPVGEHFVRICVTMPCQLRGADDIVRACEAELGIPSGETTSDGKFTIHEVQCLGACVNAPLAWIGDDYYEDLDPDSMRKILQALKRGETPKPGSQIGRQASCAVTGPTTLKGAKA
jgi:NADH-quinone oxidoreductase subunit E